MVLAGDQNMLSGQVRTARGTLPFSDMGMLGQLILDAMVGAEDSFTLDGKRWQLVRDAKELGKYLDIARAAAEVSGIRQGGATAVQQNERVLNDITEPAMTALGKAEAFQLELKPQDRTDPLSTGFSLGSLPPARSTTWAAPDLQTARKARDSKTPTTSDLAAKPRSAPTRVPTVVWMLGGVAAALLLVVGGLAAFAPELFGVVATPTDPLVEVKQALALVQTDDPAAIDAMIANLTPKATAAGATDGAHAALALLHTARARINGDAKRLVGALGRVSRAGDRSAPLPDVDDPEPHRKLAQQHADRPSDKQNSAGLLLAAASLAAERVTDGADDGVDAALARAHAAVAALTNATDRTRIDDELTALELLAAGQRALGQVNAGPLRLAAEALAKRTADQRARHVAAIWWLVAAATGDAQAHTDVDRAKTIVATMGPASATDPRPFLAQSLLKLLEVRHKGPVTTPAADAGPSTTSGPADAGTVAATAAVDGGANPTDAGVVETFETWMERAATASRQGKALVAARAYGNALKLKPGDVKAQLGLGWAYIDLAKHEDAQKQFQRVATKDDKNPAALMGLGEALRAQGKTEGAKAAFQKYLEVAPNGADAEAAKNAIRALE
jgi:cytochrome c-type biogenesis protein CcmH/NrfG